MTRRRTALALAAGLVLAAAAVAQPPAATAPTRPPEPETRPAARLTWLQAAVLGVVEGVTEYLPVSSTGHLILTSHWMGLSGAEAIEAFEIVIQLGAILAVLGLYRRRVGQMLAGLAGRNPPGLRLAAMLLVAFLPAAIVGLALRKPIKEHLFGPVPVCAALVVGGVAMIVVEHFVWRRRPAARRLAGLEALRFRHALAIGLFQCLAMWPGTSRSMVTILAGLLVGLDMVTAAEFSFLLALPTLGAATVYEGVKDWGALMSSAGPDGLLIGLAVSGVVAALAVKGFVRWLTRHGLLPFGAYRVALGAAVYFVLAG